MADFKINYAGIGVAKSGTTWIATCLDEHPQVCMAIGKETNFFVINHVASIMPVQSRFYGTSHYELGMDWYRDRYKLATDGQRLGEFSNAYIFDPESARLLHEHNPELKLMCCFRNPVDVLYAGYHQLSRVQPVHDDFETTLEKYPSLMRYGTYVENLRPFLERFSREQFHFMLFDDLKADAESMFSGICRFLGVDDTFIPPSLNRRVNPRIVLRSSRIRDLRCAISAMMGKNAFMRGIRQRLVDAGVARLMLRLFRFNEKPGQVLPLSADTRARLIQRFEAGNRALGDLLDRDLSHWN